MTPETTETQENERSQRARKLLLLLVACVLVMASLLCCGQVALLLATSSRTVDTLSLLRADYSPWGYGKVGVINASGYMKDLQKDQEQEGVVVVVPGENIEPGVFWPTGIPTPMPVAAITETASLTPTEFIPTLTATITETVAPSITPTPTISGGMPQGTATRTPTRTVTSTRSAPVATLSPTPTQTHTATYVPQPTRTNTQAPVEPSNTPPPPTRTPTLPAATTTRTPTHVITTPAVTPTRTPTHTNTVPVVTATRTPTRTNTVPVVIPTFTFTPTRTPTHTPTTPAPPPTFTFTPAPPTFTFTPTPTPIPYLLYPKVENGGSDPDPGNPETGCHGYFGYINTNPNTVTIPPGSSNYLSQDAYEVSTGDPDYIDGLPSNFYTGVWTGILHVKWDTGSPITWTINGASATLNWCH